MKITETIAAISSSAGNSGIGIIRISGDEAIEVADRVFKSHKNIRLKDVDSHTVHYGHIVDGDKIIDQVLVIVLKNPHSYTGEDTVEIDCHGGIHKESFFKWKAGFVSGRSSYGFNKFKE